MTAPQEPLKLNPVEFANIAATITYEWTHEISTPELYSTMEFVAYVMKRTLALTARDDAADLEAQLSQWRSAYIEVAGFLGLVSTDDTGRIGAVAGMEEVLAELEQRERNAAELRAALREWAEATRAAEWFELDQSNAYGTDHADAEDRVEAARRVLLALAATEGSEP